MSMAARVFNMFSAAKHTASLTAELSNPFFETLALLTRRAQQPVSFVATWPRTTCAGSWACCFLCCGR
jgi:hypothetical protein